MSEVRDAWLATVRLCDLPVPVHVRAQQHSEAMRREFYLILGQEQAHPGSVPARLLELSTALSGRYAGLSAEAERQIEAAIDAGVERIDELTFRVPAEVADAVDQLEAILDQADDWCRGGRLLTLATPTDLVRYRRWYLGSFRTQLGGGPAQPWPGPWR